MNGAVEADADLLLVPGTGAAGGETGRVGEHSGERGRDHAGDEDPGPFRATKAPGEEDANEGECHELGPVAVFTDRADGAGFVGFFPPLALSGDDGFADAGIVLERDEREAGG